MPSSLHLSPSEQSDDDYFQTLLASARPFLRGELESIDKNLPSLVAVLRSVGAGECWHKHGSFLDHLVDIYRILKIWKAPDSVCLCGLFHSAYSNSYVNLAIFDPHTGRDVVRGHVGEAAERLIHLFCIVPRQPLIHDDLLFKYSDSELLEHLIQSEISLKNVKEKGIFHGEEESWRRKINSLLPAEGITVKHIKTGEDFIVTRRMVAVFLMMTMADFSDQLFGFQDLLFENYDGRLEFKGNNSANSLWPGNGKPGLWMNSVSRMGAIYTLIRREEEIYIEERKSGGGIEVDEARDETIELVVPPVFDKCTKILDASVQIEARDLYWQGVCDMSQENSEELLLRCIEKNPYVGEPHVVLGQVYMIKGRFEEAERAAERGVRLLLEWGSPWDKRTSWEGWIAWGRVVLMKAKEKSWPNTSWGILNLGLVR
ncbi:uncharacterized protein LOC126681151 [Mercurialis annua]|uniref:uncharacterized protein LOC126681150 n=1 Tax=Mercurialis annua TaxID=3986 RepID=UPI00215E5727|nr:uncharacterized protein LOC126681150 [Mercurialis annua]XP_050232532.1 uncharacterized protein LOC126681151 [Mercurialis annua]